MLGGVVLAAGSLWFWLASPWGSAVLKLLTIGIFVQGVMPMLLWLKRHDDTYPLLEVLQLTLVPFYAVPLVLEHSAIAHYPEDILARAAGIVLLFQVCCSAAGFLCSRSHGTPRRRGWMWEEILAEGSLHFTAYTLTLTSAWLFIATFTRWVPPELVGTLRAIFFGVGTISLFLQARLWGGGRLSHACQALLVANVVLQMLITFTGLLLVTGIIMLLIAIIGYFSASRRIPWLVCALSLPVIAILHNGKHQMREIYWGENAEAVPMSRLPDFFAQWFRFGLQTSPEGEDAATTTTSRLFERASLLQIVCYVLDTVPDRSPYLNGRTYALIPPQVVPRFLWPGKPSPNDSVKILSVHLGMLTVDEAQYTSIAYGLIAEAVANFGIAGVVILAVLVGWLLRRVSIGTAGCPTLSALGIFRILCLVWCLNTETTLAVWVSSFYQACIAIFVPLLAWRSFLRK